jgi:hypothetical protein
MHSRTALLFGLLMLGCDPAPSGSPATGDQRDQGPAGGAVSMTLALEPTGTLQVVSLSIEMDRVEMLSDREPEEAARIPIDGQVALESGFGDAVTSAAPGAYSAMVLSPRDGAPTLTLVVLIAGIRVQVETTSLPLIRVRCPTPVDLPDGADLMVTAALNLGGIESALTGALFPPPLGVTEIRVTETTHPPLVAQVVEQVVTSWSLTCGLL